MRRARAGDHWRRICDAQRSRPITLKELTFQNVLGLGTGQISLHPSLTVFCGANGVGKSTILSTCGLTLDYDSADQRIKSRHAAAILSVELSSAGSKGESTRYVLAEGKHSQTGSKLLDIYKLDLAAEWFHLKSLVEGEANWDELLSTLSPRLLDSAELAELSYLVGKDYSECKLYEIEEYGGRDGSFPYCTVTAHGQTYRFEEMGAGEGSLLLVWWLLKQIKSPGILLLEEPETHITCHSQRALLDLVAQHCVKQLCCVVTTHSADMIAYVPRACVRLVIRLQDGVQVVGDPDDTYLRMALGVETAKAVMVFVEDRCARIMTRELLRLFRPDVSTQIDAIDVGDESKVLAAIKHCPPLIGGPSLVGLLDGDQKQGFDLVGRGDRFIPEGLQHPLEFLPGEAPPEMLLREHCKHQPQEIAELLGSQGGRVATALSSIEGRNHHDWLEDFAKHLDVTYDRLVATLLVIVLRDTAVRTSSEELANRLAKHVESFGAVK